MCISLLLSLLSFSYLRRARNLFIAVSLGSTVLGSFTVLANDAPPGSYYRFETVPAGRENPITKNLGELVSTAESWGSIDGPKIAGCSGNGCLCSQYVGSPSCNVDSLKHTLSCDALYDYKDGCGSAWKYYSGRATYTSPRYQHYQSFDPDKARGEPCTKAGNPCDPASGNKYEQVTDFAGGNDIPSFARSFNSLPNTGTPSALGPLWQHNYDRHITQVNPYTDRSQYLSLNATRADGKIISYFNQNGRWQPSQDIADTLTQTASGWVYRLMTGATETYDSAGNLVKETDASGKATSLGYNATNQLITITGPTAIP